MLSNSVVKICALKALSIYMVEEGYDNLNDPAKGFEKTLRHARTSAGQNKLVGILGEIIGQEVFSRPEVIRLYLRVYCGFKRVRSAQVKELSAIRLSSRTDAKQFSKIVLEHGGAQSQVFDILLVKKYGKSEREFVIEKGKFKGEKAGIQIKFIRSERALKEVASDMACGKYPFVFALGLIGDKFSWHLLREHVPDELRERVICPAELGLSEAPINNFISASLDYVKADPAKLLEHFIKAINEPFRISDVFYLEDTNDSVRASNILKTEPILIES